jgi:hypothetical protein
MISGSEFPRYLRETALVPDTSPAEFPLGDNDYAANSAPNVISFTRYHDSSFSTPRSEAKMADPTREEIQAQIAASEARGDTKIARLEGKLDLVISKLDGINVRFDDARGDAREARATAHSDNIATRANIWVAALGLIAAIVAIYALFPTFFDMGSKMRDLVEKEVGRVVQAPSAAKEPNNLK